MQKPESNEEPMQAVSIGSNTGVVDADECVMVGIPPTIVYEGRGRSHLDDTPCAMSYTQLHELLHDAETRGKPVLFVGTVVIQPAVYTQNTFTPVDKAEEEEALRALS